MTTSIQSIPTPASFVSSLVTHALPSQSDSQQIPIIGTQIAHLRLFVLVQAPIGGAAVAIAVLGENTHEVDDTAEGAEGDKRYADIVAGLISGSIFTLEGTRMVTCVVSPNSSFLCDSFLFSNPPVLFERMR